MSLEKVQLRETIDSDLEPLFRMSQDPIANEMAKVFPRTRAYFEAHWHRVHSDPSVVSRTILLGDGVVGKINSFPVDGRAHVGYLVDRAHWGRGIATRALRLFLEIDEQRPLLARVATSNAGSRRVLEKCGFVKIGEEDSPQDERYMACVEAVYELR